MLPFIIEPRELAPALDQSNLLVIDLCRDETYIRMHLPGAVHVEPAELIAGTPPAVGKLPPIPRVEALLNRIGYSKDLDIVAYDDEGGGWAGRFIWTLDLIGHKRTSYLNGGLVAWLDEGLPTTTKMPTTRETENRNLQINWSCLADKAQVLAALDDPDTVVWDARSHEEYEGTRVNAARGGHIPGAINFDWFEAMDPGRQLRIRDNIAELLEARGISGDQSIITHCQTHHRSGLTYLVGRSLGYRIAAYDGSWSEWGNDPALPIER
ncbi:MAG: rhodanese-like domain-containing protein [Proteobacteria bacterium]|nr:rhodanese-like domain-containing protein [Pseudomonadota bacterium]MDA1301291.1 rhodanese-like domain-containing protein [Pseudomonadota bacterium]